MDGTYPNPWNGLDGSVSWISHSLYQYQLDFFLQEHMKAFCKNLSWKLLKMSHRYYLTLILVKMCQRMLFFTTILIHILLSIALSFEQLLKLIVIKLFSIKKGKFCINCFRFMTIKYVYTFENNVLPNNNLKM